MTWPNTRWIVYTGIIWKILAENIKKTTDNFWKIQMIGADSIRIYRCTVYSIHVRRRLFIRRECSINLFRIFHDYFFFDFLIFLTFRVRENLLPARNAVDDWSDSTPSSVVVFGVPRPRELLWGRKTGEIWGPGDFTSDLSLGAYFVQKFMVQKWENKIYIGTIL